MPKKMRVLKTEEVEWLYENNPRVALPKQMLALTLLKKLAREAFSDA